ncbi:MAG: hypothetical protein QM495_08845 [Lutibacter sp.]|uniref:hypothetical protein n=1 Tax=Lutibacter sp. TaxID=1925666 RepID=UPI0038591D6D
MIQFEGRLIERKNFDKNNELIDKQSFEVGKITKSNDLYLIKIHTKTFDNREKLIEEFTIVYKCKPKQSSLMLMILPFTKSKSNQKTMVIAKSSDFKKLYDLDNLKNIELELELESGLLKALGSKSKIKMYDRYIVLKGNEKIIESKVDLKMYALGIRVKSLKYKVIEKFTQEEILFFQKFVKNDGSYFTVTYL